MKTPGSPQASGQSAVSELWPDEAPAAGIAPSKVALRQQIRARRRARVRPDGEAQAMLHAFNEAVSAFASGLAFLRAGNTDADQATPRFRAALERTRLGTAGQPSGRRASAEHTAGHAAPSRCEDTVRRVSTPFLPALFVPTALEPDMRAILSQELRRDGALLPVLTDHQGQSLEQPAWAVATQGTAWKQPNTRWPAQPATAQPLGPNGLGQASIVVVAALGVAPDGTRLGQGGGWYDRALLHVHAPVIAACFDDELVAHLRAEPHDQPVDGVITPRGFAPCIR